MVAIRDKTDVPLSGCLSKSTRLIETTKPGRSTTIGVPFISVMAPRTAGVIMSRL